jgi:SLOG-like protein
MSERIFLSASIPDPRSDPRFFETADVIAIRDAVRALATVVLPQDLLVWGGHPAITPMIRVVADSLGVQVQEHVWLYQSEFFRDIAPSDNEAFAHIEWIPAVDNDRQRSLERMRQAMLESGPFNAGVFIGGMEGVLEEFDLFQKIHTEAKLLPIASTGAAAREIYGKNRERYHPELSKEYAYASLFRKLLELPAST